MTSATTIQKQQQQQKQNGEWRISIQKRANSNIFEKTRFA